MNEIEEYADDGDDGDVGDDGDDGGDGDVIEEEEEEGGHKHVRIPGTWRVKTPGSDAFAFASRNFSLFHVIKIIMKIIITIKVWQIFLTGKTECPNMWCSSPHT